MDASDRGSIPHHFSISACESGRTVSLCRMHIQTLGNSILVRGTDRSVGRNFGTGTPKIKSLSEFEADLAAGFRFGVFLDSFGQRRDTKGTHHGNKDPHHQLSQAIDIRRQRHSYLHHSTSAVPCGHKNTSLSLACRSLGIRQIAARLHVSHGRQRKRAVHHCF